MAKKRYERVNKRTFIEDIVQKRRPELLPVVHVLGVRQLTSEERDSLREVVGTELVETGFDMRDKPTARGLLLEDLIDWLGEL